MPGLREIQNSFRRGIMQGEDQILSLICGTESLKPELRLEIYANAYRSRLEEALACDYERLRILLGDEAFHDLCLAYIDAHPSRFFSLRWFGGQFPVFLGYDEKTGRHDWQAEMAQLELAFVNAFDAADTRLATEADAAQLAWQAWPSLKIDFHPSVQVFHMWWNTLDRWRAARDGEAAQEPIRLQALTDCLVWREGLDTRYRSLDPLEADALRATLAGADFSGLCGVLATELENQEQLPMQAATYLKGWLDSGMVSGLSAPGHTQS